MKGLGNPMNERKLFALLERITTALEVMPHGEGFGSRRCAKSAPL